MKLRTLGRTGQRVSEIGFGAWAIGGTWGEVSMEDAKAALNAALDAGITFIDTADVYGDGRSEKIIAEVLNQRGGERPFVATKLGRRLSPHVAEGYNAENLNAFIDRSRENLQTDTLDLVQLHCPPTEVYYNPDVFAVMDEMVAAGKIRHYGVSVEKVEEGLKALEFPNVSSIQLIYNIFRQRPAELLLREAKRRDVAIIARVPLASGLLTAKYTESTTFAENDHRTYNRGGEAFDVGETFSGVDFATGVQAAREFAALVPDGITAAQAALAWIAQLPEVSTVIPGARNPEQARANAEAGALRDLGDDFRRGIREIYDRHFRAAVHSRW